MSACTMATARRRLTISLAAAALALAALAALAACADHGDQTPTSPSTGHTTSRDSSHTTPSDTARTPTPPDTSAHGTPGGDPSSALTAFTPRGEARLVGAWTTDDRALVVVFLPDGRAASVDTRTSARIRAESGVYRVDGSALAFDWLISGVEKAYPTIDGGALVLSQSPNVAVGVHLTRIGEAAEAARQYDQATQSLRVDAASFLPNVPTAAVQPGRIDLGAEYVRDPHPDDVDAGATVYAENGRFQWVDPSGRQYERLAPSEPGVTAQSYTFLPNGRFAYDGWLYGIALDAGDWVGEPLTDAEARRRVTPMKHFQSWGKYRVVPIVPGGPSDEAQGELVELTFQDGSRAALRVVAGRAYAHRVGSLVSFENYRHVELRAGRSRRSRRARRATSP